MITKAIDECYRMAKVRKWDITFWAFDIHGTIIEPNYKISDLPNKFYPYAEECLQIITQRKDIKMLLYTCSHPQEIEKYQELFRSKGINFEYVNENPEVPTTEVGKGYGNYDKKPYFNVLFEDKAGFDPITDWILVKKCLEKYIKEVEILELNDTLFKNQQKFLLKFKELTEKYKGKFHVNVALGALFMDIINKTDFKACTPEDIAEEIEKLGSNEKYTIAKNSHSSITVDVLMKWTDNRIILDDTEILLIKSDNNSFI